MTGDPDRIPLKLDLFARCKLAPPGEGARPVAGLLGPDIRLKLAEIEATLWETGRGPRDRPVRGPRRLDASLEPERVSEAPGRSSLGEIVAEAGSERGDIREGAFDAGDMPSNRGVGGATVIGDAAASFDVGGTKRSSSDSGGGLLKRGIGGAESTSGDGSRKFGRGGGGDSTGITGGGGAGATALGATNGGGGGMLRGGGGGMFKGVTTG